MIGYFTEHYSNLAYSRDGENQKGLRNAQIGAIHAYKGISSIVCTEDGEKYCPYSQVI